MFTVETTLEPDIGVSQTGGRSEVSERLLLRANGT